MDFSRKTSISGASAGIVVRAFKAQGFVGTWTATRAAAGDYNQTLTAAANSPFLVIPVDRGIRLTSVDFVYTITVAGLTSINASLYRRVNNGGAAPTITQLVGPTSLAAGLTAGGFRAIVNWSVGLSLAPGVPGLIPFDCGAHENDLTGTAIVDAGSYGAVDFFPDTDEWIELAIVNPGTAVFAFYGAWLYGDKLF